MNRNGSREGEIGEEREQGREGLGGGGKEDVNTVCVCVYVCNKEEK
jgi:hypothetical protein